MKRKFIEPALLGLVLMGIIVLAAYPYFRRSRGTIDTTSPPSTDMNEDKRYSTNMNELRDRFNQDKGKVRLLLLLSPT